MLVDRHTPTGRIEQPRHEIQESRFPATRSSDYGDGRTGLDDDGDAAQDWVAGLVPEVHMLERDSAGEPGGRLRVGGVGQLWLRCEQLDDSLGGRSGLRGTLNGLRGAPQGPLRTT